ncbi:MAG TPA: hypothetical protein VJZ93_01655 [Candidatus Nanoarchaeia archaeon]|nr:hypothetical protein [Candidatus Nanoarchaeia archaeon]
MKISSKDILVSSLSIVGAFLLTILFGRKLPQLESFSFYDILLLVAIAVAVLVYVIYKKIGEVEMEIDFLKNDNAKFNERLKINDKLINLEAKVIALEKYYGKKR